MSDKKASQHARFSLHRGRGGDVTPRLHRFPPLRKRRAVADSPHSGDIVESADYQRQLVEGFQEGINKGFEQGLIQGQEEGFQNGYQQGYETGQQQGIKEGKKTGRSLFTEAAQPLEAIASEMQTFVENYEQRRRAELLQLVEKVTRQVIRCELALQPTQLLALVEEALSNLPSKPKQLKVHLSPLEFERLNNVEPEKTREWGLVANQELEPGECRVVTDTMEMDVGCQQRLDQCLDVLRENLLSETENERTVLRAG